MGTYIIHFDDKPWEDLDDELYYRCFEIPWFSTTKTTISRLTPYTEDSAYAHGYTEAESKYRKIRDELEKQAYQRGYETAKHECEDCNTNIVVEAVRKKAYEKAYEQGRKGGKIEGQAEVWACVKKIAFKPEIVECVDDLVRMGFDVGTADSWSEAIELLFNKYSASEVTEKVRRYEQRHEEIQVGDEVISPNGKGVVTEITDIYVRIMYAKGSGQVVKPEDLTKTGRHFPEIADVLRKMDGDG